MHVCPDGVGETQEEYVVEAVSEGTEHGLGLQKPTGEEKEPSEQLSASEPFAV